MMGRILVRLSPIAIVLVLVLVACGGEDRVSTETSGTTAATTETAPPDTTALRVYFLLDGKVQPVAREVPKTQEVAGEALFALLGGPTKDERQLGLTSALAPGVGFKQRLTFPAPKVLELETTGKLSREALAQTVYTLTQFPTVTAVEIDGKRYTRADFEDETPSILLESPLPFETVANPLRATGTANTFEATFNYDLVEPEGRIVDSHFVTATSGSGERGTFDFTTKPYEISRPGLGALIVYELSAKDGSRIHRVEVPVRMEQ
jgi:hypothetical protein